MRKVYNKMPDNLLKLYAKGLLAEEIYNEFILPDDREKLIETLLKSV